jgi:flavin-dependent dehydrogenase
MRRFDTDVFIVGGGPAGLAAAIAARRRGFDVLLADPAVPPVDKACGEGLMPDCREALAELGVNLDGYETAKFTGIRFVGREHSVAARFPHDEGVGIRRLHLHSALLECAERLGVKMQWGTRVAVTDGETAVAGTGTRIRCRWMIGADGENSQLRKRAGLGSGREYARRIGLRRHYSIAPWSDCVEVYWGDEGQAYVTPVAADRVCVALISRRRMDFDTGLAAFPELARRLQGAEAGRVQGSLTVSRRLNAVHRGQIALIGDASGSVDAVTGEGMAMGFRQALALGDALELDDLALYQTAHRKISRLPGMMARAMLMMDRSAFIRRRALCALATDPALFEQMLALHVGELKPAEFLGRGVLHLGWQMLRA